MAILSSAPSFLNSYLEFIGLSEMDYKVLRRELKGKEVVLTLKVKGLPFALRWKAEVQGKGLVHKGWDWKGKEVYPKWVELPVFTSFKEALRELQSHERWEYQDSVWGEVVDISTTTPTQESQERRLRAYKLLYLS